MSWVVVDASLVLRLVIDEPGSAVAQTQWEAWRAARTHIAAPTLLISEAGNGLPQCWRRRLFSVEELTEGGILLIAFPIRYYDPVRCADRAVQLAREGGLTATYDSFFLALAETLRGEFWTGDRRLYRRVHTQVPFVRTLWSDEAPQ